MRVRMCTSKWLFATLFVACVAHSDLQTRTWHADTHSPSEIMVDVINNLGLNILKLHNQNNENNIALSPYGMVSILTALLEGVRGRAALEIQQCGGFPTDKDVIRVGLRDIHRLLRSYFIPEEGFLSGLSLSSEKVILKSEYKSILRFYGFDMTSFNTPIYPDLGTTTSLNNITSTSTDTTTDNAVTMETTTDISNTTTIKPPTQIDEITTIKPDSTTLETTMPTTTIPTTTIMNDFTTDSAQAETRTVTVTEVTDATFLTTTPLPETTTSNSVTTTAKIPQTTTFNSVTTTVNAITTTVNVATTTINPPTTTINSPTTITNPPTTLIGTTETTTEPIETTTATTETTTTGNTETTTVAKETSTLRIRRVGRSVVDYFLAQYYDDRNQKTYTPTRSDNNYSFLVGGKFQETHIHFMTYDVVLPFTYIHSLNALALRFPLDSPKYYLLLILPIDDQGIDRLLCDIGKTASLKQIVSYMRPTYVRAVIPSFMLRGFVILTSSLQKIGIREIFEPRRSDFSTMTDDQDIYVTNIEQAITVMIKNYMDPNMLRKNGNLYQYGPVEFKATHPFLYFVMDSELDVSLVAGKIVNPINSRIQ